MPDQPTGRRDQSRTTGRTTDDVGTTGLTGMPTSGADLWARVRISPIEMALPRGTGYTLRAYRPEYDIERNLPEREPDEFAEASPWTAGADGPDVDTEDDTALDDETGEATDEDEDEDTAGDEGAGEAVAGDEEEVPLFLGRNGRLYLFESAEGLVEFVRSGNPCDLDQLDSWPELVSEILSDYVVPDPADSYELDLVVENLRSGHDSWDPELLIKAGEIARDLGYAFGIDAVISALAPGSPLDDLDEALRAVESGGFGGLFARRRLRKIKEQQAALGWRTVIGKISGLVDWRD